jgi:glycine cleavage system H protein
LGEWHGICFLEGVRFKNKEEKMKCPFLEEVVVRYCNAYPVKKMIPASVSDSQCACLSNGHSTCPEFEKMARVDSPKEEVTQMAEPRIEKAKTLGGSTPYFPPAYWESCKVFACNPCPYRGVCYASSSKVTVKGFFIPDDLRFDLNHLWVRPERENRVTIGVDDFAQSLVGEVTEVEFDSKEGRVKKDETGITLWNGRRKVRVTLPFDAEVEEVNQGLDTAPDMVNREPYGRGWIARLKVKDAEEVKSMLHDKTARTWIRNDVEELQTTTEKELGVVLADGGEPLMNLAQNLDDEEWNRLTKKFLNRSR